MLRCCACCTGRTAKKAVAVEQCRQRHAGEPGAGFPQELAPCAAAKVVHGSVHIDELIQIQHDAGTATGVDPPPFAVAGPRVGSPRWIRSGDGARHKARRKSRSICLFGSDPASRRTRSASAAACFVGKFAIQQEQRLRCDGRHGPSSDRLGRIRVIERFQKGDHQCPLEIDVDAASGLLGRGTCRPNRNRAETPSPRPRTKACGKKPRPPISRFSRPLTASIESRIASASRRRRFCRQKRSLSASMD